MKRITLIFLALAFFAYGPSVGISQEVGDIAPDFSLVDDTGSNVKLRDFRGKKNVVLVVYAEHK